MACYKKCLTKNEAEIFIKHKHCKKKYRREFRAYYCESHNAWHTSSKDDNKQVDAEVSFESKWKDFLK